MIFLTAVEFLKLKKQLHSIQAGRFPISGTIVIDKERIMKKRFSILDIDQMTKMSDWQREDFIEFGADYDRPRSKQEIKNNRDSFLKAEKLIQKLEKNDSENFRWFDWIGEEDNGQFKKYPGELKNYDGQYLDLDEQKYVRSERKMLMQIRDLIGFHEYHSDDQQDLIIKMYLIYRKYGLSANVIARLMDKKTSYFRSTLFINLTVDRGIKYQSDSVLNLNQKLHRAFDKAII